MELLFLASIAINPSIQINLNIWIVVIQEEEKIKTRKVFCSIKKKIYNYLKYFISFKMADDRTWWMLRVSGWLCGGVCAWVWVWRAPVSQCRSFLGVWELVAALLSQCFSQIESGEWAVLEDPQGPPWEEAVGSSPTQSLEDTDGHTASLTQYPQPALLPPWWGRAALSRYRDQLDCHLEGVALLACLPVCLPHLLHKTCLLSFLIPSCRVTLPTYLAYSLDVLHLALPSGPNAYQTRRPVIRAWLTSTGPWDYQKGGRHALQPWPCTPGQPAQ